MTVRTVVFDMDGTLVKTRTASWEVFQDTARQFALPVTTAEEFYRLFEGNFFRSLTGICPDARTADAVRAHFMNGLRDRYEPEFVPGMVDVVKALAPHFALAVMSSNSMDAIRRILETAGVAQCFAHVFSAEVGTSKRDHLRRVADDAGYGGVRQCAPDYLEGCPLVTGDPEVVLVTDTVGDVADAVEAGARAIGVAWGMHPFEALLEAGAERVVYWPQEIVAMLLPGGPDQASACACTAAAPIPATPIPATPIPATPAAAIREDARRLGRSRHARRAATVVRGCRCGAGCGLNDGLHSCGAPDASLVAAIGRIARTEHRTPSSRPLTEESS